MLRTFFQKSETKSVEASPKKKDKFGALPAEIQLHIWYFLSGKSQAKCEAVSKEWNKSIKQSPIYDEPIPLDWSPKINK